MNSVVITESIDPTDRVRILGAELRLLRTRSDLFGTSATIHALRNSITTAQGALGLVGKYREHGRQSDAEGLLDLAETRLRDARRLLHSSKRVSHAGCA